MIIEPIDAQLQQQVTARTEFYISEASGIFGRAFDIIPVKFDLSGRTAGMFRAQGRHREIRYNPWIFAKYFQENLDGTVPHEVAHYIVYDLYGAQKVKPHGEEWKALMSDFGANSEVTFKLDLNGVPQRRQRTHSYRCSCRLHEISTTRHNRIQNQKGRYLCRYCRQPLTFAG